MKTFLTPKSKTYDAEWCNDDPMAGVVEYITARGGMVYKRPKPHVKNYRDAQEELKQEGSKLCFLSFSNK